MFVRFAGVLSIDYYESFLVGTSVLEEDSRRFFYRKGARAQRKRKGYFSSTPLKVIFLSETFAALRLCGKLYFCILR